MTDNNETPLDQTTGKDESNPEDENKESETTVNLSVLGPEMKTIPIVGIGASAGGLEALELFLRNVPIGSGIAYVIVQHLDPSYKGILVELLQRSTSMPVVEVSDRLAVEPNSVYVIPPNKDMSLLHGVLHLFAPVAPRGLRLPIDFFLRSLADDCQEHSIGVILSGMGSDGTLGLRAIKEKAGATFVQNPATAQFDGMPRSAVDAGLADVVAAVEELPLKINAYLKHLPTLVLPDLPVEAKIQSNLEKILILIRAQTGHDFSLYKKSTINRRIERRMGLHQIDRLNLYVKMLQENPREAELLFKELLIGVTSFFRDPAAWEYLKTKVIPEILQANPQGGQLRAWTAGCSTGEEAYSLGIIFKEALELVKPQASYSLQIFATDLDREAIDRARLGFYPINIAADVTPERLRRFFVQEEQGYRVGKEIREMVVFAPQNLVMDAPFTRLDLLICRNLLIYFEAELQKKLLPLFHYSLNREGVLFLGSSETIGGYNSLFNTLETKFRIYRRQGMDRQFEPVNFPGFFASQSPGPLKQAKDAAQLTQSTANIPLLMEQLILKRYAPAAVLTSPKGDILYVSGRTGRYLEPAVGKASLNLFSMAREGLVYELSSAYQKAALEPVAVTMKNLRVGGNGDAHLVDVSVQQLYEPEGLRGMVLVVFNEVDGGKPLRLRRKGLVPPLEDARARQLEIEIQRAQEELQTTREEMQTSQEELKSANEELQSTNEEMQSTNEELTTSKEEMQSLNEELQTVNHELQARVEDLSRSNNDMKNLLDSTQIATLFLDETLHVRRFTSQAAKLIKLIPGDMGRSITDIASALIYPELGGDVQDVLRSLTPREKPVVTREGNWYSVRIMAYRTLDNRIDGVVITFTDITVARKLETALRQGEQETQAVFQHLPHALGLFEAIFESAGLLVDGRVMVLNDGFEGILGLTSAVAQGRRLSEIWPGGDVSWLEWVEKVLLSSVPAQFDLAPGWGGKKYRAVIYRPGESRTRFGLVLSETENGSTAVSQKESA